MPTHLIDEDIVISGVSGRYPESDNVEEFKENLYAGVNMVTEDDRRWKAGMFGTPKGLGKLKNTDLFDHLFFEVHGLQANCLDPAIRILLEVVYEAIFDSGYTPCSMVGKSIGVFVGNCGSTYPEENVIDDLNLMFGTNWQSGALFSNEISFLFDFKGPSLTIDTGCSSSVAALEQAILSLRAGRCEAAVVAGSNMILKFSGTSGLHTLHVLSPDNKCKAFDSSADGFVRAEAISAIFLQKSTDARRSYATVLHCKGNNDGKKKEGITCPSKESQKRLFKDVYRELGLQSKSLEYLEAHGTGTKVGDPLEGQAISEVLCAEREKPLLVGSVKTNTGHSEGSSGVVALTKVILLMEEAMIPANLHFKDPNPSIEGFQDGLLKVVTENTPFPGGLVAINNYGLGGCNYHVVLRSNQSERYKPAKDRQIPRLVLACGRTDLAVKHILETVNKKHFNDEALALLEEATKVNPKRMRFRGYSLLANQDTATDCFRIHEFKGDLRPVWFLYSGMGSQWSGMAKSMMGLEPFARSIKKSAEILKPLGVDLIHLLIEATDKELDHIVAPFVTIAAVQIALTEILVSMGVKPDGIIGHSAGELGCSFADGSFTATQMLLTAYWRGKSCEMSTLIYGKMAAIGMTWEEAWKRCPDGVFPVCHNAEDSVTISGPAAEVQSFLYQLKAENIFAREVKTGDIAFHSKYVEPASVIMRRELEMILTSPVKRSEKWICSSFTETEWQTEDAQYSSADYHIHNLLSPVLFKEAMSHVPKNALIIEIAPHALLESIVKRNTDMEYAYVGLMNRNVVNNLEYFLDAIGKLYAFGLNPSVRNLYRPISFPVPPGTPMLNSLIVWDHSQKMTTWSLNKAQEAKDSVCIYAYKGGPFSYFLDHVIEGRVLFPATGYLWLAWKAFAKTQYALPDECPVVFEEIRIYRAAILSKSESFIFHVKILDSSGNFNILENGSLLVSGIVRKPDAKDIHTDPTKLNAYAESKSQEVFTVDAMSFYKELRLRGYEYGKAFQGVTQAHSDGLRGLVKWEGNWATFLDSALQMGVLLQPFRMLVLPTRIRKILINPSLKPPEIGAELTAVCNPWINRFSCGPVEFQGLHCFLAPRRPVRENALVLEEYSFTPYYDCSALSEEHEAHVKEYIQVCSTLAYKSLNDSKKQRDYNLVVKSLKLVPEELVQKYVDSNNKDYILPKILKGMLSKREVKNSSEESNVLESHIISTQKVGDLTNKSTKSEHDGESVQDTVYNMSKDLLSRLSFTERVMRDVIDIILDTCKTYKINILEISHWDVMYHDFKKTVNLSTNGLFPFQYTILRTNEGSIPKDVLNLETDHVEMKSLDCDDLPEDVDLIVSKNLFTHSPLTLTKHLHTLVKAVKENGFFLLIERTSMTPAEKIIFEYRFDHKVQCLKEKVLEDAFAKEGLAVVAKRKDQTTFVMYLLRKIVKNPVEPRVFVMNDKEDHAWVEDLKLIVKENVESEDSRNVWVVAQNPNSGVVGFMNAIRGEEGGSRLRYVYYFNGNLQSDVNSTFFDTSNSMFQELLRKDLRSNVHRNNQWGYFSNKRLSEEIKKVPKRNSYLNVTGRDLSSLKWIESPHKFWTPLSKFNEDDVKVQVFYSALNFRDVMIASGKLKFTTLQEALTVRDCRIGYEFSGVEMETGRRVMGLLPCRGLANTIVCSKNLLFDVPQKWTLEEACTVPIVYLTAYYALLVRGKLRKGESVLVHAGSGGVGQAAISICLSMGCRIYTTVGSEEKKEFLVENFSDLSPEHIYNSRSLDFEMDILNKTSGEGVDVVLNSLAEEMLLASVRCLKTHGRFLEIGLYDIMMDHPLGMFHFSKNIEFHGIFLNTLMENAFINQLMDLADLLIQGISKGEVKPLKSNVFPREKAEEAFRFLGSGKHIGKVILKIRDEDEPSIPSKMVGDHEIQSVPRTYFDPRKSVIITGGLGGFGFELCHWLIERGAKHVVLSSRSVVKNSYQRLWIKNWTKEGLQVKVFNQDITDLQECRNLLKKASDMAPIGAIFHLAMVLHDGVFLNTTKENFTKVCAPKVEGAKNLDVASRDLCPDLEYFCAFSSVVANRGIPGLSNYAYANSAVEKIIEHRRAQGLPGQAIQYGAIGDVGIVYEQYRDKFKTGDNLKGTATQSLASCLDVLDRLLQENLPVSSSYELADQSWSMFDMNKDLLPLLCKILGILNPDSLSPDTELGTLGMDSLMVVEAKQILEAEYDISLSTAEILKLTVKQLKDISKKKLDEKSAQDDSKERISKEVATEPSGSDTMDI